jgi:hypothetical protein
VSTIAERVRVESARDVQTIELVDIPDDAPRVDNPYNSVRIKVDWVVIEYGREATANEYHWTRVEARGKRLRSNSEPGTHRSEITFSAGGFHKDVPPWLVELAEAFTPIGPPTMRRAPGTALADATDLDTLEGP